MSKHILVPLTDPNSRAIVVAASYIDGGVRENKLVMLTVDEDVSDRQAMDYFGVALEADSSIKIIELTKIHTDDVGHSLDVPREAIEL